MLQLKSKRSKSWIKKLGNQNYNLIKIYDALKALTCSCIAFGYSWHKHKVI